MEGKRSLEWVGVLIICMDLNSYQNHTSENYQAKFHDVDKLIE